MNWNITKTGGGHRVAVTIGLAAALLVTSVHIGRAQSYRASPKGRIIGTWFVEVTLRNCATDAALGSFNSLTTFHEGGTLSESTSSPTFATGQRGPGHGNWTAEGRRTYNSQIVNLINFYSPPKNLPGTPGFNPTLPIVPEFFPGWATVTFTTELSEADGSCRAHTKSVSLLSANLCRRQSFNQLLGRICLRLTLAPDVNQNVKRAPSWNTRGRPAPVIRPKSALVML